MPILPNSGQPEENKMPPAGTGNASNPPLKDDAFEPANQNQLIDERGEKYLREIASIEDYPDAQDDQDMDETINQENKEQ
ncbi:MAG TPA: hypothetical protein VD794_05070 [Flavisolibacter sp.]|nr:hypothetical protein [Flavisolibacter sp.]